MAGIYVKDRTGGGATVVPNRFIDQFLPEASGEFVKVYLFLLRHASREGELSLSRMAEGLCDTEKNVHYALKYWERMGLLALEYASDGSLKGIGLLEPGEAPAAKEAAAAAQPEKKKDLADLRSDEEFLQLLYLTERYTGAPLSPQDADMLANLYGNLGMSAELLEYLVEYCVSGGNKSMRYIEKVALSWHKRGIASVEQAREENAIGGKHTYAVLRAFGITGRSAAPAERDMLDRWLKDYRLPVEVVLEACDRTMRNIHKPNFAYADKILQEWKKAGVRDRADVERIEEKRRDEKKAPAKRAAEKRPNRFHNFQQRDYDYDELVKQINGF